ncbi:hypothetical protein BH09VER1_BH09VER1_12870 [soil metagenome]
MERRQPSRSCSRGFTLIELLVATAILLIMMVILLQMTGGVGQIWKSSAGKISAFQNARSAFSTVSRTLARATLNTYNDYVDASGNPRTAANSTSFVPAKFLRASELQFIVGPASLIVPGATATTNPGSAVFFQAPLGETDSSGLRSLNRTVNSTGFYIEYGAPDAALLPTWLKPLFGATKRFRLMQFVEPTESLQIYDSTAAAGYDLNWLQAFKTPRDSTQPRARVLAEDVPLLIMRPRLSPQDEQAVATSLSSTYSDTTRGSILSPNYHYDSRTWESGYPSGQRVTAAIAPTVRAGIMRNQVPPIMDLAMVSVDRRSLVRFGSPTDPPDALKVPAGLFTNSANLDADLATYGKQLSDAHIRYRIFRTSVEIQGSKWSNN